MRFEPGPDIHGSILRPKMQKVSLGVQAFAFYFNTINITMPRSITNDGHEDDKTKELRCKAN